MRDSTKSRDPRHLKSAIASLIAIVSLVFAAPATSHRSVTGQFDISTAITLKGVVKKVRWVNPHIYALLEAQAEDGSVAEWRLGTVPVGMARRAGISPDRLLSNGEPVTVRVCPARDGTTNLAWMNNIEFADGTSITMAPDCL